MKICIRIIDIQNSFNKGGGGGVSFDNFGNIILALITFNTIFRTDISEIRQ